MLITGASAQTAEAVKAGSQAAETFANQGVLGATIIFLLIAVGVLFWLLQKANDRNVNLIRDVVTVAEASKTAAAGTARAVDELERTVATVTKAVETLAREAEGEAREMRHGLGNLLQIVGANAASLSSLSKTVEANAATLDNLARRGRE